jgi:CRISPR-associated protein Csb2
VDCTLIPVTPVRGAPPADHFLARREEKDPDCGCRHVIIDFGRPVQGPVLIGRFRYFGMGLCLPKQHWYPGSNT